jgi:hypothetical protein
MPTSNTKRKAGMNYYIMQKNRKFLKQGRSYIGSVEHMSDVAASISVHRLGLQDKWGSMSGEDYEKLCGMQMRINRELSNK